MNVEIHKERRSALQARMAENSLTIIFAAKSSIKSNDVPHRFRQNSDFYYLTGFEEESSVLAVTREEVRLYLRPRDAERELWGGRDLGVEAAKERLLVDQARDIAEFSKDLPELVKNKSILYYLYGRSSNQDAMVFRAIDGALKRSRRGSYAPTTVIHPALLLHEMRLVKSEHEIELMRECACISADAHRIVMERARPGMYEYELEALLLHEFRRRGAVEGFASIVASGPNACYLHYIANNRRMEEGDLALVDAGAEKNFMNGDISRTFPVGKRFTPAQRTIYELVLAAQKSAVEATVRGSSLRAVHDQTVRALVQGLLSLGILKGDLEEIVREREDEKEPYKKFYPHGTGHWLGCDVHDVGLYYRDGKPRPLVDGMVCTVEPGLYLSPEDDTIPAEFRGIGVRIEDDVVVRGDTPEVLTGAVVKEIDDVEAVRG